MNDVGKEEKGIESRHPSIYIFRHGGKEGGGDRAIYIVDFIYTLWDNDYTSAGSVSRYR
jgi:hypothetical protein